MDRTRSCEHLFFDRGGLVPPPERLRKVLIVGAGVAGLQTARQMLKLGAQVLILETNDDVGGVWIRNYIGFGLQVPWRLYQFAEFPWPKDLQPASEYPTGQEVLEYVRSYCREYDLRRYIRFNCKLLRLRWCPSSRQWDALYCDTLKEKFFKVTVDYTVICAGIYSQPYIPDYEGTESYAGIQLHAKEFVELSLARGRRVVIVGAGKTALDCVSSIVATNTATSVTLLYRQAHWPIPRRMLGTSVRRLLFNRAMITMMPPYYTASRTAMLTSKATAPLRRLFWRSMESVIGRKFRITEQMRPRVDLPADLFYGGQILDNTMDKLVRSEALVTIKGEINRFVRNGVILQDGNFVAADLVLYCTGYLKTYEYLEGDMRARLDLQKDGLYLYRNCLPCAVPHLAFIGSEVSTYNNILSHGLQALWLAHVLSGRVQLPPSAAMVEDVRSQQRWRRSIMPAQRSRGSVLMLYMMDYHDQLLQDIGYAPHRKGYNLIAECFGTYSAMDYVQLMRSDHVQLEAVHRVATEAAAQLVAAGVPPAILAASAAGRSGVVSGTTYAAVAAPEPSPPAAASTDSARHNSAAAPAPAAVAATSVTTRAAVSLNPLYDDRFFRSSREGTSASTRSYGGEVGRGGLEVGQEDSCSGLAAASSVSTMAPGGVAAYGFETEMAAMAALRMEGDAGGFCSGTAQPERVSRVDVSSNLTYPPEAVKHGSTASLRPDPGTAATTTSAAVAGAASSAGALICSDMSKDESCPRDSSGSGGLATSIPASSLPAHAATFGSQCEDPARSSSLTAHSPRGCSVSAMLPCPVILNSGSGGGGGGGSCGSSGGVTTAHVSEGLAFEPAAEIMNGYGSGSFAGLGPAALTLTPSVAVGYASSNSPSRLCRHTGPGSPIPRSSALAPPSLASFGKRGVAASGGGGEAWNLPTHPHTLASSKGQLQQHQQHQQQRWGFLSREEVAEEGAGSGCSNCSVGGSGTGGAGSSAVARQQEVHVPRLSKPGSARPVTEATMAEGGDAIFDEASGFVDGGCTGSSRLHLEDLSGGSIIDDGCSSEAWHKQKQVLSSPVLPNRYLETHPSPAVFAMRRRAGPPPAVAPLRTSHAGVGSPTGRTHEPVGESCMSTVVRPVAPLEPIGTEGRPRLNGHDGQGDDGGNSTARLPEFKTPSSSGKCGSGTRLLAKEYLSPPTAVVASPLQEEASTTLSQQLNNSAALNSGSSCRCSSHSSCSESRSSGGSNVSCDCSSVDRVRKVAAAVAAGGSNGVNNVDSHAKAQTNGPTVVVGCEPPPPSPSAHRQLLPTSSPPTLQQQQQHQPAGTPVWHALSAELRAPLRDSHVNGTVSEGLSYGSPCSGTLSLSLWYSNPIALVGCGDSSSSRSAMARKVQGAAACSAVGLESRLCVMKRGREQVVDSGDEDEGEEEDCAEKAKGECKLAPGGTSAPAEMPTECRLPWTESSAATAAHSTTSTACHQGGTGDVTTPLNRTGSVPGKSLRLGSRASSSHLGASTAANAREWRRVSGLARSTDGIFPAQADGAGGSSGGGWPLVPAAFSGGMYSTGSSTGQILSSISLAGGIAMDGSGSSAVTAMHMASRELVPRLSTRLLSCPTTDSIPSYMVDTALTGSAAVAPGGAHSVSTEVDVRTEEVITPGKAAGKGTGATCPSLAVPVGPSTPAFLVSADMSPFRSRND